MALPPASRLFEGTLPNPATGGPCLALRVCIAAITGRIADRVTLVHENFAKIADSPGRAGRQRATIFILAVRRTVHATMGDKFSESNFGCLAATPFARICIATRLRLFRSVDPDEANFLAVGP